MGKHITDSSIADRTQSRRRTNLVDAHIGQRVRFRRISLGLSQEDLSAQLGLSFQQVQKYESGANRISASRLLDVAGALKCTFVFFFEGLPELQNVDRQAVDANPHDQALTEFMGSRECVALCQAFMSLDSDAVRRAVIQVVRAMAETKD
jgi:transcriptional regulator with XRE-family HTH domain